MRHLIPPSRFELVKNILVSNVWSFFLIRESLFPLTPTIILQGVSDDFMCFLNGPLQNIEHQIIPLAPNDPKNTNPEEKTKRGWIDSTPCTKVDRKDIAS